MRITEEQLYEMICESINDVLMEDGTKQPTFPDINGNFTEKGDTNSLRRGWHNIRKHVYKPNVARAIASAGMGVGGTVAGSKIAGGLAKTARKIGNDLINTPDAGGEVSQTTSEYVSGGRNFGGILPDNPNLSKTGSGDAPATFGWDMTDVIQWGVGIIIGTMAIGNIVNVCKAIKGFDTRTVPSTRGAAIKALRFAGINRIESQKLCLQTQIPVKNAINAYYLVYKTQLDIDGIMQEEGAALGVDCDSSDLDINFTDRLAVPPSNLSEATNNTINDRTVKTYVQMFQQINDAEKSKEVLSKAIAEFIKALGVWKSMTNYIEDIVEKYGPTYGISMETALIGGRQSLPIVGPTINMAYNTGKLFSRGRELLQKFSGKKEQEQTTSRSASSTITNLNVRIVNTGTTLTLQTDANGNPKTTINCIILQQDRTNHYFAIPINKVSDPSLGQGYVMPYAASMITKIIKGNNGAPIYIMGKYSKKLTAIDDGVQQQNNNTN